VSPASSEVNGVVPCGSTATGPTSPLAASGGSGSVSVVAGCSWTASDNVPWLTITSGASGSGNGTVSFTVTANPGTAARFATITVAGLPVTIAQNGDDFGGDGHPDMIWINDTTRQATLWNMGGAQGDALLSWSYLSSAGIPGWTIVGTADFDKDGHPDIVWQNDATRQVVVWYMGGPQGDTMLQWDYLSTNGVPGWTVVGAGDFNNDGHPDIVWQNDSTREATVWYMGGAQGLTLLSWNYLSTVDLPGWRIAAVGDINRDGQPDLVWQNDSTRQVTVWYMGGTSGNTMLGWSYISASGVPGWSVVGASDFDADGILDIVWQNDATRQVTVWYMGGASGNTLVDWTYLSSAGIPGWKAIVR
jgi:hypothetical protein